MQKDASKTFLPLRKGREPKKGQPSQSRILLIVYGIGTLAFRQNPIQPYLEADTIQTLRYRNYAEMSV